MDERAWLAERFIEHRPHLRAVAYRMLGSLPGADDAVQEAWVRLDRSDTADIENLKGWLTTVVSRVCLDVLRSRRSRREEPLGAHVPDPIVDREGEIGPEHEALLADSVGLALLVVLDTLTPAERLAFVLHDTFGMPFGEIAPMVGRTPAATRKLASRARRRVREVPVPDEDLARQREVVGAFLAASRDGDFGALLELLDTDAVLRADTGVTLAGAPKEVRGARGGRAGARLRGACSLRKTGARQRDRRACRGPRRTSGRGHGLHRRRRKDRRDRHTRRSRPPWPDRHGLARRVASGAQTTHRPCRGARGGEAKSYP
jgi:RNA polymerase sigma factor (sigma-70 family)